MGYLTEQMYNQPMVNYVDPRLDILANSMGAVQKRHDENYAAMNAFDIMAKNIEVSEGDSALKQQALAKLAEQTKAIADSGDYAYATPRIGMAVKDFSGNENLTMAQQNMQAIKEAEKRAAELGASALDFNPGANWSTIDPSTQKARRFVSGVEQRKDWDKRAQEVTTLIADAVDAGLTPSAMNDYLQSGTISGISDTKVRGYLTKAIDRFANTEEGDQMYRKLTKIDGLSTTDAEKEIARYLYGVGSAQIHRKENINYQVNQPAMTREGWARDDARAKMQAAAEIEKERIKALADIEKEKAKATKADKIEGPTLSPFANTFAAASKFGGTAVTNETIKKLGLPVTKITDAEGHDYEGFIAQNAILDLGDKFKPETGNYSYKEVKQAEDYHAAKYKFDTLSEKLKKLKILTGDKINPKVPDQLKLVKDLELAEKEYNKVKGFETIANKYNTALSGDKAELAKSIGQKISNSHLPFNVKQGDNNFEVIDGKFVIKAVSNLTEDQLEARFNSEERDYMENLGLLTKDNNDNYTLNFKTSHNVSPTIAENYDNNVIPGGPAFEQAGALAAARNTGISNAVNRTLIGSKIESGFDKTKVIEKVNEARNKLVLSNAARGYIDTPEDKAHDDKVIADLKTDLNNYSNLSHQKREKVNQTLLDLGINLD